MALLSNNSCIWTRNVYEIVFGSNQFDDRNDGYLVEFKPEDFDRVKTYKDNFIGFCIDEKDEIKKYEDVVKIAKEQEAQNLVVKFC